MAHNSVDAEKPRDSIFDQKVTQELLTSHIPISITWSDVKQQVDIKKWFGMKFERSLEVLKGVSGAAKHGELLAILGGSGSGKTSLLNILAGRAIDGKMENHIQAEIKLNGQSVSQKVIERMMRSISGYVTQEDYLLHNLTVRETLQYAALLKLPRNLTRKQKLQQVEHVIQELRLTHCADTIIGGAFVRGVSGGERRRVSIGIQLLTNPSILFLDEPTSGLDSTTAHNVVSTLLSLARNNRTIVCTIHQPRSDIFTMFDKVLLLSRGQLAYYGKASDMVPYFSGIGHKCPIYSNPADFALDLINVDTKNAQTEAKSLKKLEILVKSYQTSISEDKENQAETEKPRSTTKLTTKHLISTMNTPSAFSQFMVLLQRASKNIVRDKIGFLTKFLYSILLGILFGGVCWDLSRTQVGINDRIAALNLLLGLTPFMAILACIVQWQVERLVFTRELKEGMYTPLPFFMSKVLSEVPFDMLLNLIYCCIVYWMLGLNDDAVRFIIFYWLVLLNIYCSQSFGYVFAALIPNFLASSTAANASFTVFVLTSGWAINYESIPIVFRWVKDISFLKYGYEALSVNEFKGESFYCSDLELSQSGGYCPLTTGEQVLNQVLSMKDADINVSVAVIAGITVLLRLFFYLLIRFKNQTPAK